MVARHHIFLFMVEYICNNTGLLTEFIRKLISRTEEEKVNWSQENNGIYYPRSDRYLELSKFCFEVFFNEDESNIKEITLYIDERYKTYTPSQCEFWDDLCKLFYAVKKNEKSVANIIQDMMDDLQRR